MQKRLFCLITMMLSFALWLTGPVVHATPSSSSQTGASTPGSAVTGSQPAKAAANKGARLTTSERVRIDQDILNYKSAISELESREGVYGPNLTEKLSSLGSALQYIGQHEKAITIFKRGIHINRINDGLYTTTQVPLLERQIASHMAMGQWQEVNNRYRYLHWLYTQNYGKDDPRILPALNQMSKWHLQAYAMQFGKDRDSIASHLISAHTMIEKSISLLERSPDNNERLIEELNGLTLTNYLFATYQRSSVEKMNMNMPMDPESRHSAMMIDQYINRSFRAGKDAINRVIDIYSNMNDAPPWSVPKAKVKMADWLFMFNKRNAAFALYQEAYNDLTNEASAQQELKKIFDKPVALPNLDLMDTNNYNDVDQAQYDADNHYVLASFDVTAQGKAANIEIIESKPEDNISARSQVKKSLRIAKFRPRFVAGGEPALTEKMQLRVLSH
jgi:tetratricopeptide (TPR) repeat protein